MAALLADFGDAGCFSVLFGTRGFRGFVLGLTTLFLQTHVSNRPAVLLKYNVERIWKDW